MKVVLKKFYFEFYYFIKLMDNNKLLTPIIVNIYVSSMEKAQRY